MVRWEGLTPDSVHEEFLNNKITSGRKFREKTWPPQINFVSVNYAK